jgi:hypothetical protein
LEESEPVKPKTSKRKRQKQKKHVELLNIDSRNKNGVSILNPYGVNAYGELPMAHHRKV